jgi:hypothetical protein
MVGRPGVVPGRLPHLETTTDNVYQWLNTIVDANPNILEVSAWKL